MKNQNFILINLNQNISRARQAANKDNRDKWIIFTVVCVIYAGLIGWFFNINSNYNELIEAREQTISEIEEKTKNLKQEIRSQIDNRVQNSEDDNTLTIDFLNLSKKDIELAYKIGEERIPWSEKLMQLSQITPDDMCITKLEYSNNSLNISAISKIKDKTQKDQKILNDFITSLEQHEDFGKEFVEYKMKNGKRVSRGTNPYYQFQISAPLKKKIKNRLNEIEIKDDKSFGKTFSRERSMGEDEFEYPIGSGKIYTTETIEEISEEDSGIKKVSNNFPPPPKRPVEPNNFDRDEAYNNIDSKSAKYLNAVEDWRIDINKYKNKYPNVLIEEFEEANQILNDKIEEKK